jgi:tRNA-intron endonuclease, archaea type
MKKFQAYLTKEIISSNDPAALALYQKSCFGKPVGDKVQFSLSEALFLAEKNKIEILSGNKKIPIEKLIEKFRKIDNKIQVKYQVFKDLREKGYIVKTALKFGAEFRVYDKGAKPGKKHARWIVFTDHESKKLTWYEFSAKNRIAHSTKKNLLIAIVDEEGDITYYEIKWIKV